jgi:hypothetical protein
MNRPIDLFHQFICNQPFSNMNFISGVSKNIDAINDICQDILPLKDMHVYQAFFNEIQKDDDKAASQSKKKVSTEDQLGKNENKKSYLKSNLYAVLCVDTSDKKRYPLLALPLKGEPEQYTNPEIQELSYQIELQPDCMRAIELNGDYVDVAGNNAQVTFFNNKNLESAQNSIPHIVTDSWEKWIKHGIAYFEKVVDSPFFEFIATHPTLEYQHPKWSMRIGVGGVKGSDIHLNRLFEAIKAGKNNAIPCSSLSSVLSAVCEDKFGEYISDEFLIDKIAVEPDWLLGMMDETKYITKEGLASRELHPLDNTQRQAVRCLKDTTLGQVLAINGPPGSGKTSMLKAVIAHQWVEAAISGAPCPITVASGHTNQSVENVIGAFPDVLCVASDQPSHLLYRRWFTGMETYGTFFPSQGYFDNLSKDEQQNGVFGTLPYGETYIFGWMKNKSGAHHFAHHSHVDTLEQEYTQSASEYFETTFNRSEDVTDILQKRMQVEVVEMKQWQKTLLNLFETKSAQSFKNIAEEVKGNPAGYHGTVESQLLFLADLCGNDSASINKVLNYVCREYVRDNNINLEDEIQLHPLKKRAAVILADRCLDLKYRAKLFHLAARYWEGQYIHSLKGSLLLERTADNVRDGLRRVCMLTPCIVSTLSSLPKLFGIEKNNSTVLHNYVFGCADLLILDETGQAEMAKGFPLLAVAKRTLAVGDIVQLQPIRANNALVVERRCFQVAGESEDTFKRLETSQLLPAKGSFLHLMRHASAFNFQENGLLLRGHYRCNKDIIGFCDQMIYNNKLFYEEHLEDYAGPPFLKKSMSWVDSSSKCVKLPQGSKYNPKEVELVVDFIFRNWPKISAHYNKKEGSNKRLPDLLAIVTPYTGQALKLREHLILTYDENEDNKELGFDVTDLENLTIGTVDSLQGAERPVVIFSAVHGKYESNKIHFENTAYLLNVAVSRAKHAFVSFICSKVYEVNEKNDALNNSFVSSVKFLGAYLHQKGERLYPKNIVLIEAGGKKKALQHLLGIESVVLPSGGHIVESSYPNTLKKLEQKLFKPKFELTASGQAFIDQVVQLGPTMDYIYLAMDDDIAGETIAWHTYKQIELRAPELLDKCKRVRLRAITRKAVKKAFSTTGSINLNMVKAEISRSVADHIISFIQRKVREKYHYITDDKGKHVLSPNRFDEVPAIKDDRLTPISDLLEDKGSVGRVTGGMLVLLYKHLLTQDKAKESGLFCSADLTIDTVDDTRSLLINSELTDAGVTNDQMHFAFDASQSQLSPMDHIDEAPGSSTIEVIMFSQALHNVSPTRTQKALQRLYEGNLDGSDE